MGYLTGRVGGKVKGYDVNCQADSTSISGRIGGKIQGGDINLVVSANEVTGHTGPKKRFVMHYDINLKRDGDSLEGSYGSGTIFSMRQEGNKISGKMGHPKLSIPFEVTLDGNRLTGGYGVSLLRIAINTEFSETEPMLAALASVLAAAWFAETAPRTKVSI